MKKWTGALVVAAGITLFSFAAFAYYGTVEFLDGRILNGRIEVMHTVAGGEIAAQQDYNLGLFVPREGAYMMIPLVEIKRIEFNWNHLPRASQPYYLRNEGDIKVTKLNGEVIQGAYFGSAAGVREFKVVLDNMRQEPIFLNDNKLDRASCIRSISFETVHEPEPESKVMISGKTGEASVVNCRVNVETADLLESPAGPVKARLRYGVGLTSLETKGEWVRVRTVGEIEVEGWVKGAWITKGK